MKDQTATEVFPLIILTAAATGFVRVAMAPVSDLSWPLLLLSLFVISGSAVWLTWCWVILGSSNKTISELTDSFTERKRILTIVLFVASVGVVSFVGQLLTVPNLAWYATLRRPSFVPPNWLFTPVWLTLYVLMAFAVWRIARLPVGLNGRSIALFLFSVQLALNLAWSWLFFELRSPLLALINIVTQLACIVATAIAFARLDRIAAWCLAPLGVWVAYAVALNIGFWSLNR